MYRDSQEHASKWGEIYMLHICIERSVEAQFNRNILPGMFVASVINLSQLLAALSFKFCCKEN